MTVYWQQGDVPITAVTRLPDGAATEVEDLILAHGEATGHAHRVVDESSEDAPRVRVLRVDNVLYIDAKRAFRVRHEEHKPIEVPAGVYRIGQVREFDHFNKTEAPVWD